MVITLLWIFNCLYNETAVDKGDCRIRSHEEVKTEVTPNYDKCLDESDLKKQAWYISFVPPILHIVTLIILGICLWGVLWSSFGEGWEWNGEWFRLVTVGVIAWGSGQILQEMTNLPPLLAALLTGIIARHLNFLDMSKYMHVDAFLRKIYPVIILGKGSLSWDLNYMKNNWIQTVSLGVLPWAAEVTMLATMTHLLLGFPWIWGFMLGAFYASVSCPVIMPLVIKHGKLANGKRNWTQLICTAGGIDTALSVGVFGLLSTFLFYETNETYRYAKAALALVAGVALGVSWGTLSGILPRLENYYVTELRVLMVLIGGLTMSFITSLFGWGGTAGVAVLACNATAATFWAKDGWKLNNNPASTAYRVIWAACEPVLFAFTGTFFVIDGTKSQAYLAPGFAILAVCLVVRLSVAFLVSWNLTIKERLFMCCTWIPKSIVEAVLCPIALNSVIMLHMDDPNAIKYAENIIQLIVQAIFITTPLGFLFTNHLGPKLLKESEKDCEQDGAESYKRQSFNGSQDGETHR